MSDCKVLVVHPILWSHYKAKVFSELYGICKKEQIEFRVLQIALNWEGGKKLGRVDTEIHRYPYKLLFEKDLEQICLVDKIIRQLREVSAYKPNVLVLPGYADASLWMALIFSKFFFNSKIIVSTESTVKDHARTFWKEGMKRVFVRMCDAAFCYGTAAAEYMEMLGMRHENAFTIMMVADNKTIKEIFENTGKNAANLKIKYGAKERNFVYVGRLSAEKNLIILLKAFKKAKETTPRGVNWGLIIVGDGPKREEIERFVQANGIPDVVFAGGKFWRDVPVFYALSDVFVLPSVSEPWGLVANEAMICGLPVIISNRAGASFDLVQEGENGFKFNPEDTDELVGIMKKFIAGEVDAVKMGKKSQEIIERYRPEAAALQMINGIKSVFFKSA